MTTDLFWQRLAEAKDKTWCVDRFGPYAAIRCRGRCPIEVAGKVHQGDVTLAAKRLGLSYSERMTLVSVADTTDLSPIRRAIRQRMLKTLGLEKA